MTRVLVTGATTPLGIELIHGLLARQDVEKFLRECENLNRSASALRTALKEFASLVADDDELHRTWAPSPRLHPKRHESGLRF